ncbi:MAG: hypothetical protein IKK02_04630 [Tidjanibacter sp.]|nr:hypothetical protein [Tidjanibacter sp.]
MKKIFGLVMLATIAFVGCTTDEGVDFINDSVKIEAAIDQPGSRVGFSSTGAFFWTVNDAIGVTTTQSASLFSKMSINSGDEGESTATFTAPYMGGEPQGYAVYPYNAGHKLAGTNLTYNFPASYEYTIEDNDYFVLDGTGNSFNPPMWSAIEDGKVYFKHLGGVLCVKIANLPAGSDQTLTVTASNKITGEFTADLSAATPVLTTSASNTDNVVTITYDNAAEADRVFYIPVPTGVYDNITVSFMAEGETVTIPFENKTISARSLQRLQIGSSSIEGGEAAASVAAANKALEQGASNVVIADIAADATNTTIVIPEQATIDNEVSIAIENVEYTGDIVIDEADDVTNPIAVLNVTLPEEAIDNLVIDMPNTTVYVNGVIVNLTVTTAENTLVLSKESKITNLVVKAGNVELAAGASVANITRADDNTDEVTYVYYYNDADIENMTIGEDVAVMSIAEKELRKAIENGGEYTLTSDVVLRNALVVNGNFTLDLAGYTISQERLCDASYAMITNLGELTIVGDGAIIFEDLSAGPSGSSWGTYVIRNQGDLTISLEETGLIQHKGPRQFAGSGDPIAYVIDNHSAGVVEINGGTISSPKSRSLRNFYTDGDVVINGGVFEGQVWMQQGNASGSGDHTTKIGQLTITGGEFSPAGADGSSVFLTNHSADNVKLSVTGGTFNTKIGCNDATKAGVKGKVVGGIFTESAKDNTNSDLFSLASEFVDNGNGTYTLVKDETVAVVGSVSEFNTAMANEAFTTIKLSNDLTASEILVISRDITLDGNTHTLTSSAGRAINVSGANDVTIKNLVIKASGERAINVIQSTKKVTIDNVTATAANYTVNVAGSAAGAKVFIQNSDLTGLNAVNIGAANVNVSINNTTITCNDNSDVEAYDAISLNKDAVNSQVMVTGGNIVVKGDSVGAGVTGDNASVTFDGTNGNTTIQYNSFIIAYGDYAYTYTTLEAAIEKAKAGETIQMTRDVTINKTVTIANDKKIVLDMNGHKLSYAVDNDGKASAIFNNLGDLSIVNSAAEESVITFVASDPDLQAVPAYATNTITNEATLYIGKGVTVINESDGGASYAVDDKGKFVLDGGTLTAKRCALRIAKYNQDDVWFTMNAGSTVTGATPAWIQLPSSNSAVAPKITVVINGGVMQSTKANPDEADVLYTYSYGNSHANTSITINGGEFLGGTVSIGAGYKGDAANLTINGGTFDHDVVQWLENDEYKVLFEANK